MLVKLYDVNVEYHYKKAPRVNLSALVGGDLSWLLFGLQLFNEIAA